MPGVLNSPHLPGYMIFHCFGKKLAEDLGMKDMDDLGSGMRLDMG